MSGTNAWLKLRNSKKYSPKPYLLDADHNVWRLPYFKTLNHTAEEIEESCKNAVKDEKRLYYLKQKVVDKLAPLKGEINEELFLPEKMTLSDFIKRSKFVFIGLHGGIGEDGTLQKMLEDKKIPFNGSGSKASRLCMDKYETGEIIRRRQSQLSQEDGIYTCNRQLIDLKIFKTFKVIDYRRYWNNLTLDLGSKSVIVKPHDDGCSAGIARLYSAKDMERYVKYAAKKAEFIPDNTLRHQHGIIEMPSNPMKRLMFEKFIITDKISVIKNKLKWQTRTNWIEITVGILENKGKYHAMNPSMTVAVGNILTLEEKFQGGTGVNITPPPTPFVKPSAVKKAKERMEITAKALGINGYARIDAFMHVRTGELIIIEANTTPALTPSTVIYQQALAENNPMYPTEFLEQLVKNSIT